MNRNKHFNFRVNETEHKKIKANIEKAKLTVSQYLLKTALNKEIVVIEDIAPTLTELRRIGNNLNQLTRLCHEGKIVCLELNNMVEEVSKIWQLLNLLIQNQT